MESKFAELIQTVQSELFEDVGAQPVTPEEVEGMVRWASQGNPADFNQYSNMKGDEYVQSMLGAYRQTQQAQQGQAQQGQAQQGQAQQGQQTQASTNVTAQPTSTPQTDANGAPIQGTA